MIQLSKKWGYALKAILYIAEKSPKILKIKDISLDLNISESLLRRIIASLEKWDLIETIKGRTWGVLLKKELKEVSIYDILKFSWEKLWITTCTSWLDCSNKETCNTTIVLWNLQKSFNSILKLYTLDKIINKK